MNVFGSAWEGRTKAVIHEKHGLTHPKPGTILPSQVEVQVISPWLPYCLCAIDPLMIILPSQSPEETDTSRAKKQGLC